MKLLDQLNRPRYLTKALAAANNLISERGEANGSSMAQALISQYQLLDEAQRQVFYTTLAEKFSPDPIVVATVAQAYAKDPSALNQIALTRAAESPRQELFRRMNRAPGGTKAALAMRRELLRLLDKRPDLAALDYDIRHLLSSWFNPGFLKMHQVDWRSPAHVLEKIIQHEAVHAIDGWDDLRRRLQPDRRCFAFFHPQLPDEPLIFVEVALLSEIPSAIGPLVDKKSLHDDNKKFKVAAFYSISNCEPGLRGVSLGNFLIKRVAEHLKTEFPSLNTFVTLSPIPGFIDWLTRTPTLNAIEVPLTTRTSFEQALEAIDLKNKTWVQRLSDGWTPEKCSSKERAALTSLCAIYLMFFSTQRGGSPVAKFHLGNGAELHRLNWAADLSKKGLRESAGLMVNYLYNLESVEENHGHFAQGQVIYARSVAKLI
jgi:malonyl-CoA decarboxylase